MFIKAAVLNCDKSVYKIIRKLVKADFFAVAAFHDKCLH